ncbi:hypothetical protein [Wolbachia endosymbiont of Pentidionis agamae]|uniref:hypothetical protein n=1 Tax=Wolbachia endosymbiont of Pentidionis agamae TaxID=3110435 RepID=UPI002FD3964B
MTNWLRGIFNKGSIDEEKWITESIKDMAQILFTKRKAIKKLWEYEIKQIEKKLLNEKNKNESLKLHKKLLLLKNLVDELKHFREGLYHIPILIIALSSFTKVSHVNKKSHTVNISSIKYQHFGIGNKIKNNGTKNRITENISHETKKPKYEKKETDKQKEINKMPKNKTEIHDQKLFLRKNLNYKTNNLTSDISDNKVAYNNNDQRKLSDSNEETVVHNTIKPKNPKAYWLDDKPVTKLEKPKYTRPIQRYWLE